MKVILVFIDGVGLGAPDGDNPFVFTDTPFLRMLFEGSPLTRDLKGFNNEGATLLGLDATLGVDGLPQSATGQAAIFTGVNAPRHLGYHLNGFPDDVLRKLLAEKGIFASLGREEITCSFLNGYRPLFFEKLNQGLQGRRYSCSTLITYYGGLPFYSLEDIGMGRALYMDLTNEMLKNMGYSIPRITPEEAGKRLLRLAAKFDFSLFEYFLSDRAGHLADRDLAAEVVSNLDRFLGSAADSLDPAEMLLVVTSDHGNLEDISHSDHTLNEVPALLIGAAALRREVIPLLHDLTDILPALRYMLKSEGGK